MLRIAVFIWLVIAIVGLAIGVPVFNALVLPALVVGLSYIIGVWVIP